MKIPSGMTDLLLKPMDRKEFLQHIGVATLFILGLGSLFKAFFGNNRDAKSDRTSYGSSPYGG